jgi:membrane protein
MDGARRLIRSTRVGRIAWDLAANLARHNVASAANAMAFDAFLSMIPLIAITGWVLNRLHARGDKVLPTLLGMAPQAVSRLAGTEFLRLSAGGAAAVPPISLVVFMWVTSSGIATAIGEFEVIFAAPARGYWVRRALAMGWVIGSLIVFGFVAVELFALGWTGTFGSRVAAVGTPVLVSVGGVAAFFRLAVRRPPEVKRRLLPGALVTVALWTLLSVLFSLYVSRLARYATLYGSLATVAILCFWLWLLCLSLLIGGEVNAQLEGVRRPR